jgi:uncharacterized hydrophobic protein (TIGR00271 family)
LKVDPNAAGINIEKNFFSQDVPKEGRASVLNNLFFNFKEKWQISFWLMLLFAVGIATLGLSENSAATVIGAMIVAPLGQPIVALGGAIALGWRREGFRMLGLIFLGALTVIIVSYLFGILLETGNPNGQILARTSPDLRDLGIALFAGAAGAYGYFRSEYSSVLAGVAIAVALVPPLCTCGLMLEESRFILAKGGFLLFFTNLVGIVFAAILTFFILGMKHSKNRKSFVTGTIAIIIGGLAIFTPLTINYNNAANVVNFQSSTYNKAVLILNHSKNSPVIESLEISGTEALITINPYSSSSEEIDRLTKELQQSTGLQVILQRFIQQ